MVRYTAPKTARSHPCSCGSECPSSLFDPSASILTRLYSQSNDRLHVAHGSGGLAPSQTVSGTSGRPPSPTSSAYTFFSIAPMTHGHKNDMRCFNTNLDARPEPGLATSHHIPAKPLETTNCQPAVIARPFEVRQRIDGLNTDQPGYGMLWHYS